MPLASMDVVDAPEDFFARDHRSDTPVALVLSAEQAAAYTYRNPGYTVVPSKLDIKLPAGYAMPRGERNLQDFINTWIELKQKDRTVENLFEHWIMAGVAKDKSPRWSIIRDVLHWID